MELQRALYNMSALADLAREGTSEKDFQEKIESAFHVVMGTFLVSKGAIFTCGKDRQFMAPVVQRGFSPKETGMLLSHMDNGAVLGRNEPLCFRGEHGFAYVQPMRDAFLDAGAEVLIPLLVRDDVMGTIVLGGKLTGDPYGTDDLELLRVVANQIAITLNNHNLFIDLSEQLEKNKRLYEEMRLIYHDTIQAFAAAIDAKDVYTKNHSQRVARYAVAIARELGWDESDVEGIYIAGFLHDVGKLIISNEVLNKKEALTERELTELRRHPLLSYKILSKIRFPWKDVVDMIKHHHEKLDGSGYPSALTRDDLSEGVKILALADSFDAMTSERSYRRKLDLPHALDELKRCLDTQFDGKIVSAFCRALEKEIRGVLPEPNILPHLESDFDPSVITGLLEAIIMELSDGRSV